ncbi:N-alpha-acetyltransferase 40 [Prorops nasuta]|uniref:N-alpha-acetyltransferase 40 n=1 Tax=Prorops nasuta TaxID=863751 RepID=UPI0034CE1A39
MMKKQARKTRRQLQAEKAALSETLVERANAIADPLASLEAFHTYVTKDGFEIHLKVIKAKDADAECLAWILDIMDRNMKKKYEQSKWGWNAEEKKEELTEEPAQYLLATCDGKYVGFSHFRFDLDAGVEVLYCYELQLEPEIRRKGLGRFMMYALESMAYHNKMKKVVLTVFMHNPNAVLFFRSLGYRLDNTNLPTSGRNQLDYIILSNKFLKPTENYIDN